jgi:hypothetical protein
MASWWLVLLGGLFPLTGASQPTPAHSRKSLADLEGLFAQRLEASCHYQETVLPPGRQQVLCWLKQGGHRYLLEHRVAGGQDSARVTYSYTFLAVNGHLITDLTHRYSESVTPAYTQPGTRYYDAQDLRDGEFQAQAVTIVKTAAFDPLLLLSPWASLPASSPHFILQSGEPATQGDTVAAYTVQAGGPARDFRVHLWQRRDPTQRTWCNNRDVSCSWWINPVTKQVRASTSGQRERWLRTYHNPHYFIETHDYTFDSPSGAGAVDGVRVYTRRGWLRHGQLTHEIYRLADGQRLRVRYRYQ